ncbi:MAG TPA: dihydroneopterin aldolase, partial [Candidatus Thalassarchaeaceae archaeon]
EVTIDGSEAPISDEITHVLNYEYLLESVEKSLTEGRVSLLESLGSRILEKMMAPSQVSSAKIQITKLEILKENGTLGCRMTRTR